MRGYLLIANTGFTQNYRYVAVKETPLYEKPNEKSIQIFTLKAPCRVVTSSMVGLDETKWAYVHFTNERKHEYEGYILRKDLVKSMDQIKIKFRKKRLINYSLPSSSTSEKFPMLPLANGRIMYTEVVKESGSANDLYSRCRAWFAKTYVSAQKIIQADINGQEIVGKPVFKFNYTDYSYLGGWPVEGFINYVINVKFKDGRYKYEIYGFSHQKIGSKGKSFGACEYMLSGRNKRKQKVFNKVLVKVYTNTTMLIESLKKAMKDDW